MVKILMTGRMSGKVQWQMAELKKAIASATDKEITIKFVDHTLLTEADIEAIKATIRFDDIVLTINHKEELIQKLNSLYSNV